MKFYYLSVYLEKETKNCLDIFLLILFSNLSLFIFFLNNFVEMIYDIS